MHALITGASRGIGFEIAKRFAREGIADLKLSLCSRTKASLEKAQDELHHLFPAVQFFAQTCNVSDEKDVQQFTSLSITANGPIDILVNNAGFGLFKTVEEMSAGEFDSLLATDLRGVFLTSQAVLPGMKQRKNGTIVTISSLAGKNGFSGGAAYCASKFGVRGLMQSLFLDVREFNIRVATIFPGSVETDFFAEAGAKPVHAPAALRPENVAEAVVAVCQLPDYATISEIDIRPTNPKRAI